jgi:hypothetical protein
MSGFLRWAGGDDQCYWLTAFLAAHDAQALMRRLIATTVAKMGLIPTLLIASAAGPRGVAATLASLLITGGCLAMAALWLRARWPSRLRSQLCAIAGASRRRALPRETSRSRHQLGQWDDATVCVRWASARTDRC